MQYNTIKKRLEIFGETSFNDIWVYKNYKVELYHTHLRISIKRKILSRHHFESLNKLEIYIL